MIRIHSHSTVASPVLRAGLALVFLLTSSGCYAYQPIIGDDLTAGDPVRLRLSAATAEEVTQRMGGLPVRSVEGSLLRVTPDSLRVDAGWGAYYAGTVFEGRRDTLQFHRSQILEVDRRQLSRTRTGIVLAAFVAAGVAVIQSIDGGGTTPREPGPGNPTFFRIPIPR